MEAGGVPGVPVVGDGEAEPLGPPAREAVGHAHVRVAGVDHQLVALSHELRVQRPQVTRRRVV